MKEKFNLFREQYRKNPAWCWLVFMLLAFPVLPEYLSPFVLFAGFIIFKKYWSNIKNKALLGDVGKFMFMYTIYMVASGIWSKTHIFSSLVGMLWMGCFLMYVFLANTVNSNEKLKKAITFINISSGIIGLIAVIEMISFAISLRTGDIEHRFPNPFYYNINGKFFDALPFEVVHKRYASRASSTFDNPLILATFLVITSPFCAFGSTFFVHSRNRKLSRVCWFFSLAGIIATTSRGAYIAAALGIIIFLFSLTRNRELFRKALPFVVLLSVAVPVGLVVRYKNSSTDFLSSNTNRFDVWHSCYNIFMDDVKTVFIGLGSGTENIHTLLRDTYLIDRTHAHNLFLELLLEGGLFGLAIFAYIFIIAVKMLYELSKHPKKIYTQYTVLYISSLIGFLAMSLFEHTLQSPKELMTFFMLFGFMEATHRIAFDEAQKTPDSVEEVLEDEYRDNIDTEKETEKEIANA